MGDRKGAGGRRSRRGGGFPSPVLPGWPLRPYQARIAKAVGRAIEARDGLTFSVEISRQGGKNETSAWIELLNLAREQRNYTDAIKAAPTLRPQALISRQRLSTASTHSASAAPSAPRVRTSSGWATHVSSSSPPSPPRTSSG